MGAYRPKSPSSPNTTLPACSTHACASKPRAPSFATPIWTSDSRPAKAIRHRKERACVRQVAAGMRRPAAWIAHASCCTGKLATSGETVRLRPATKRTERNGSVHKAIRSTATSPTARSSSRRSRTGNAPNCRMHLTCVARVTRQRYAHQFNTVVVLPVTHYAQASRLL